MTQPQNIEAEQDASAVAELMQQLEKCLRATQLYLPNNPMYSQAIDSVRKAFAHVWIEVQELNLRVKGSSGFEWEGIEILGDRDKQDSMAWTLYKDGIRALSFLPGVEEEEIVGFLGVINQVRSLPSDAEDDLLTLLWEREFSRIQYLYVELGADDMPTLQASSAFGASAPPPEKVRQQMEADVEEEPERPAGLASIEDFDSTLYFLEDQEVKHLKEDLEREYQQNLRINVLSMLFDILEVHTYADAKGQTVGILENLLPHILGAGDYNAVAYIIREGSVIMERVTDLAPELKGKLEGIATRLSSREVLSQMLQTLDESHTPPAKEDLGQLFRALRPNALDTILEWLPKLTNETMRDLLEDAIDPLAQYHPDAVGNALISEHLDVLIGAIRLVTRHNLQTVSPLLSKVVTHKNPAVRLALVDALATVSTPSTMQALRKLIDDPDREVRIAAVKALTEKRHGPGFEQVKRAVTGKLLKSSDLAERQAFFEAFGALGGNRGIEFLSSLLVVKGILKKKWDPETRACAAMALGKAGTPEAKGVLENARDEKDALVRNAVLKAMREIK